MKHGCCCGKLTNSSVSHPWLINFFSCCFVFFVAVVLWLRPKAAICSSAFICVYLRFHSFLIPKPSRHIRTWKLSSSISTTKCQPSTNTNSSSLKGNEINTGGSMSMPIEIVTLATTISRITNGR